MKELKELRNDWIKFKIIFRALKSAYTAHESGKSVSSSLKDGRHIVIADEMRLFLDNYASKKSLSMRTQKLGHLYYCISFIEVKEKKGVLTVSILTSRPGLIIGKGGETIEALQTHLSDHVALPVKIKIYEHRVF